MALSDGQIFAIVLDHLNIHNTQELIDTLGYLDDDDFSRAFDLHALITYRLHHEQAREATEQWMKEVKWDEWPKPTKEEREYLRRIEVMHERMGPSNGGIDIWDSIEDKLKKMENAFQADHLFSKARRK